MCLVKETLLETILEYHWDVENSTHQVTRETGQFHLRQSCLAYIMLEREIAQEQSLTSGSVALGC